MKRFGQAWAWVRASVWLSFALRAVAVAAGLLLLAWIGGARIGGALAAPANAPGEAVDAAAPSLALSETVDAAPHVMAAPAAAVPTKAGFSRASTDSPVILNQASVEDLRRLPGVGVKRADAIVELRHRIGRFQRIEDLLRVKGIGRSAVKKWRPLVRLESPDAG